MDDTIHFRFWSNVRKTPKCWIWTGGKFSTGYGRIRYFGKSKSVHRVAYSLLIGNIPKGMLVCHKCDVPLCVNPRHLFLGTPADNSADMVRKGRQAVGIRSGRYTHPERTARGEHQGSAKLTESDVIRIIELRFKRGISYPKLARMFGVTHKPIMEIISGENWRHIPRPCVSSL